MSCADWQIARLTMSTHAVHHEAVAKICIAATAAVENFLMMQILEIVSGTNALKRTTSEHAASLKPLATACHKTRAPAVR